MLLRQFFRAFVLLVPTFAHYVNASLNYNKDIITKSGVTLTCPFSGSLLQSLSAPTLAGYLDQTFGQSGTRAGTQFVNFSISNRTPIVDRIFALTTQPDGKIVAVGTTGVTNGTTRPIYFAIARFLPNGHLDPSFGQVGTAYAGTNYIPFSISGITLLSGNINDVPSAVFIQPDGKILVCGQTNTGNGAGVAHPAVARFLSNGTLDTSFGQVGTQYAGTNYVPFSISNVAPIADRCSGAALQPDGKIVLACATGITGNPFYAAVVRFLPNGQLDTSFGQVNTPRAGTAYIPFSMCGATIAGNIQDVGKGIVVTPTGSLVMITYTQDGTNIYTGIAQFTPSGQLDISFGTVGTSRAGTNYIPFSISNHATPFSDLPPSNSIALQPNGSILTAVNSDNTIFSMARFLSNGTLDTNFGQVGTVRAGTQCISSSISGAGAPSDQVNGLALQPDGKILLVGYSLNAGPFYYAFARFGSSGQLDPSFGISTASGMVSRIPGTSYTNFSISNQASADVANNVILQTNGEILAGGSTSNNNTAPYYFALARLTNQLTQAYYQAEYPNQGGFY